MFGPYRLTWYQLITLNDNLKENRWPLPRKRKNKQQDCRSQYRLHSSVTSRRAKEGTSVWYLLQKGRQLYCL
jgi:hypothetical protein